MLLWGILVLSLFVTRVVSMIGGGLCMQEHVQTQICNADYVIRVKVMSNVKLDVPDLPPRPTQAVKPKTKQTDNSNNETEKKRIVSVTPVRRTKLAPEPFRFARSITGTRVSRKSRLADWRYQEIKIKKVFKGVGLVRNTLKTQLRNRINGTTRYKSQLYVERYPNLEPGRAYMLAGKIINNRLYLSGCNWYSAWNSTSISHGQIRRFKKGIDKACKCKIKICYEDKCEDTKDKGVCWWRPHGYHPLDDCLYKHSTCQVHRGNCQWIKNEEYKKCRNNETASLP